MVESFESQTFQHDAGVASAQDRGTCEWRSPYMPSVRRQDGSQFHGTGRLASGRTVKRREGLAYLTRCADETGTHWSGGVSWLAESCPACHGTHDAGWLHTPCSRYGRTSADCAPVAWRVAYILARETGESITTGNLDHAMSLVVNDHDDVAYIVRNYGAGHYR